MLSRLHTNPICQVWNRASGSREVKNVDVYMPMAIAQTDDLKTQVNMFSIFRFKTCNNSIKTIFHSELYKEIFPFICFCISSGWKLISLKGNVYLIFLQTVFVNKIVGKKLYRSWNDWQWSISIASQIIKMFQGFNKKIKIIDYWNQISL